MTPCAICMARITVRDRGYPATFIVLQQYQRYVILVMEFMSHQCAIVDLKSN